MKLKLGAMLSVLALMATAGQTIAQDKTIAGITFQNDMFFRMIQIGMETRAKAAGAEILLGNSESKPDKEAQLIDTYISRGVDAIVVSPISATASAAALQRAKDAGIVVVTYNSAVEGDIAASYLNSNQRDLGETTGTAAAAFIRDQLGGNAKIATLGFASVFPEISGDRIGGFLEKAGEGNTIEVVSEQDGYLPEMGLQVAGDIITANPDINIIFAANEGGTVGAVQAVRQAGKEGKIFVFGTDGSAQIAEFLLDPDNVLQAVTAQQPLVMGEQAVQAALDVLEAKKVDPVVVVPVLGLSRSDPAGVQTFVASLPK